MTTRREVLCGIAGAAAALMSPSPSFANEIRLSDLARAKGLFFGTAVTSEQVTARDRYSRLLGEQCDVWTPEWELKWGDVEYDRGHRGYHRADTLIDAAQQAGKRVRGHALLWHEQYPSWATELDDKSDWDSAVLPWLIETLTRYSDRIFHWDVVNEPIEPEHGRSDQMRVTPFLKMLGPAYISETLHWARTISPTSKLYLNEYGLTYHERWQSRRRDALLRLIERLLSDNVPLDGIGIQCHLNVKHRYNERVFADFLEEIEAFGLDITLTELDVTEGDSLRGSLASRQARAAEEVRKVLTPALDSLAVKGVVTWTLSDRASWLRRIRKIEDNQGLPFDDQLRPAPCFKRSQSLYPCEVS